MEAVPRSSPPRSEVVWSSSSSKSKGAALEVVVAQLRTKQRAAETAMVRAAYVAINSGDRAEVLDAAHTLARAKQQLGSGEGEHKKESWAAGPSSGTSDVLDTSTALCTAVDAAKERHEEHAVLLAAERALVVMESVRACARPGDVDAEQLRSLEEVCAALPAESSLAMQLLNEVSHVREQMQAAAVDVLVSSLRVERSDTNGACRMGVRAQSEMRARWDRAADVGMLDEAANAVARLVADAYLLNESELNAAGTTARVVVTGNADASASSDASGIAQWLVVERAVETASTTTRQQSEATPAGTVVSFLSMAVCGGHATAIAALGAAVWPLLVKRFENDMDAAACPGPSMAENVSWLLTSATDVEKLVMQSGFAQHDSEREIGSLMRSVDAVLKAKAQLRRKQIVCDARAALMSVGDGTDMLDSLVTVDRNGSVDNDLNIGNGEPRSNVDEDAYCVSSNSVAFLGIVRGAFGEARSAAVSGGSPILARELLQAAADATELALALFSASSTKHAEIPQLAIVYANNFRRMAQVASALALEATPDFLACGLGVLEAMTVRVAACCARGLQNANELLEKIVEGFLGEMRDILAEMIDLRSFKTDIIIRSFDRAIHVMHRVLSVFFCGEVLSRRQGVVCVARVVEHMCRTLFGRIMQFGSIDADECERVHAILSYLTMNVKDSIMKKEKEHAVWKGAFDIIAEFEEWKRLCAIADTLDTPLREITVCAAIYIYICVCVCVCVSVSVDGVVCVSTTAALTLLICVRFVLPMYLCILYSTNCVTHRIDGSRMCGNRRAFPRRNW